MHPSKEIKKRFGPVAMQELQTLVQQPSPHSEKQQILCHTLHQG